MRFSLLLSLFLLWNVMANGAVSAGNEEEVQVDQLSPEDQFDHWINASKEERRNNSERSLQHARKAFDLASSLNSDSIDYIALEHMAKSHHRMGHQDSALHYYDLYYALSVEYKDTVAQGQYYRNTGAVWRRKGEIVKATESHFQALELFKALNDSAEMAKVYNGLGLLYNGGFNADYQKALDFFLQAITILAPSRDTSMLSILYTNIAFAYKGLKAYDSAIHYLEINIDWQDRNGYHAGMIMDLKVLGNVYTESGDYQKALDVSLKSLDLGRELNNKPEIIEALHQLSVLYLEMEQPEKALPYAREALKISEALEYKVKEVFSYQFLYRSYEMMGQQAAAYPYLKAYLELKQNMMNEEKSRQLVEMQTKYETEKMVADNEMLALHNRLADEELAKKQYELWGLVGLVILLAIIFAVTVFSFRVRHRLREEQMKVELQDLRSKITGMLESRPDAIDLTFESLNTKLNTPLSEREFEVLNLILSDLTYQEVADRLHVSINTVKFHLRNIYEKLGVNNRKEALKFVISSS